LQLSEEWTRFTADADITLKKVATFFGLCLFMAFSLSTGTLNGIVTCTSFLKNKRPDSQNSSALHKIAKQFG